MHVKKKSARDMLIAARKSEKAGDFNTAKQMLAQLLRLYPKNSTAQKRMVELEQKHDQANLGKLPQIQKQTLISIVQQGRIDQAAVQAISLLKKYPKDTFLSNFLGAINLNIQRWNISLSYYELTYKNDPKNIDAAYNLAVLHEMLGDEIEACKFYKHVISLDEYNYQSYNNLAAILLKSGDFQAAEENYLTALEIKPDYADALNNYGMLLSQSDRHDNAISYCKAAVNTAPENSAFLFNLCDLLEKYNRLQDLGKVFEQAAKTSLMTDHKIAFQFGKYKFRRKNYNEAVDVLEGIPASSLPDLIETKRLSILGKSHDKLNNANKAFDNFCLANDLAKANYLKTNDSVSGSYINNIEKNLEQLCLYKDQIKQIAQQHELQQRATPIFLIGFPRSGTTLLDTILRSHPNVQVAEEKPMLTKSVGLSSGIKQFMSGKFTTEERAKKQDIYFEELEKHADVYSDGVIIDKLPLNMINLVQIKSIFPDAKFIFSVRHPCDCILSCFMQDFSLNDAMVNFLTIEDSTNLYNKAMSLWKKTYELLGVETCFIKYENLITNFDDEISKCLNFLGLSWHDDLRKYREMALARGRIYTPSYNQVSEELYTNAVNRWQRYEKQLSDSIPILNPWIEYWEY